MKLQQLFEEFDVEEWKKRLTAKIVYEDDNGYFITIDKERDPTYIALWKEGKTIGKMYLKQSIKKLEGKKYTLVDSIDITPTHRNKRLGKKLYQMALNYISTNGLVSYLPDRSNKKQVPKIYRSLGGYEIDDWAILPK